MDISNYFTTILNDLIFISAVYIFIIRPIEYFFNKRKIPFLRKKWLFDLSHSLFIFTLTFFVMFMAKTYVIPQNRYSWNYGLYKEVSNWPLALQILYGLFIYDLVLYWLHRLLHNIPYFWRFHYIHHFSSKIDYLISFRTNIFESIFTVPFASLASVYSGITFEAYMYSHLFVFLIGNLLHLNVRIRIPILEKLIITPYYHHMHHSTLTQGPKNMAFLFPIIDKVFGSYYLPKDPHWNQINYPEHEKYIKDTFLFRHFSPFTKVPSKLHEKPTLD